MAALRVRAAVRVNSPKGSVVARFGTYARSDDRIRERAVPVEPVVFLLLSLCDLSSGQALAWSYLCFPCPLSHSQH